MNPILDEQSLEYAEKALKEKEWPQISSNQKLVMALSVGLVPLLTRMAVRKKIGLDLIPKSLAMGAVGYAIPSIINDASLKKQEERREFLKSEFDKVNPLSKFAALPAIGGVFAKGLKYLGQGSKDLARGVFMPIRGGTVGQKALSIGSKALLGYGAYKAGKYVAGQARQPNYVDYLRNQVVSGNIRPDELSQNDMGAVRQLGMN